MRRAIARTRLRTRLKHQRRAKKKEKKSRRCLIKKAPRCAEDPTSKTTLFIFHFLQNTDLTRKLCVFIYYCIGSVVKIVLYLHFP